MGKYIPESPVFPENWHTNVFDNEIICHCGKKGCLKRKHQVQLFIEY